MDGLVKLLFLTAITAACNGQQTCPSNDWWLSEGTCYYIDPSTTQTWAAANAQCQTLGGPSGRLASVYNDIQNTLILDLKTSSEGGSADIWLGLASCQQAAASSGWYWYDKERYLYTNWVGGAPSGAGPCGAADLAQGSQWVETDCAEPHGIACKSPKVGDSCPAGFEENDNNCYLVNPALSVSHDDAVQYCTSQNENSHLTSITSVTEAEYIDELARGVDGSGTQVYWVGLYNKPSDQEWSWLSGADKAVEFWDATQPDNSDPSTLCSYMGTTAEAGGMWSSTQCNGVRPYVCKMMAEYGCDPEDDWVVFNTTMCFYIQTGDVVDQNTAYRNCKKLHPQASLAWIETEDENSFILDLFSADSAVDPWIGYYRCNNTTPETSWIWLDAGSPVGPEGYVNFLGDRKLDGGDTCSHMAEDGHWISSACDFEYGLACQTPAVMTTTTTMSTTTEDGAGGGNVTTTTLQTTTTDSGITHLGNQFLILILMTITVIFTM